MSVFEEFVKFGDEDVVAVSVGGVLSEVILVVFFGAMEFISLDDLGDNGVFEGARVLDEFL